MFQGLFTRIRGLFAKPEVTVVQVGEVQKPVPVYKYDLKTDLIGKLTATKDAVTNTIIALKDTIPNIEADISVTITELVNHGYRDYETNHNYHDLNTVLSDTLSIIPLYEFLNSTKDNQRVRVVCTYKKYYVHSFELYMESNKEIRVNNTISTSEIIQNSIMDSIRWEVIEHTIKDLYNINRHLQCDNTRYDRNTYRLPESIYLTFSIEKFLNFHHMKLIHGKCDVNNISYPDRYNNNKISLTVSHSDSIEKIRNAIVSINEYIDKLFEAEQVFLRDNLYSIIAVRTKKGEQLIIHTSTSAPVIINDVKIEYTDLFTGLRNTIIIHDNVTNISEDNLKPKHTTMLPSAHRTLFNQNSLELLS